MSGGRVFVWVLLGLLVASMPASAETGSLQGRATLPLQFAGNHETAGQGALLASGHEGTFSMQILGEGTATRVIHRAFGFVNSNDPEMEVLWSQATERVPLPMRGATLTLTDRFDAFQVYVSDGQVRLGDSHGSAAMLGGLSESKEVSETFQRPVSIDLAATHDAFTATIPAGQFQARATTGTAGADGAFKAFVSGARLTYTSPSGESQEIQAYFRAEDRPGALYNPIDRTWFGGGTHTEYVQESLSVEATAGLLDATFTGIPTSLFAAAPILTIDGETKMPGFDGAITVQQQDGDVTHNLRGEALKLTGRFTLEPQGLTSDSKSARISGNGDFTTVSYGVVTATYPWATITAVGFGALALAALAWATANGKALLGIGGGGILAGYARVQGDEVLEHAGRGEVYERVKAAPGVNFVQLSDQVSFGASTLNYHLRVLERNGYITSVRDGRYLRFFDRRSGHYSGERKNQVSALRNPTSAAMARHIRENPGVAQCDLATKFSVTPSTVTWHMNRLATAGLVNKERDQTHTRYYLAQGWANLPVDEQARFQAAAAPVAVAIVA